MIIPIFLSEAACALHESPCDNLHKEGRNHSILLSLFPMILYILSEKYRKIFLYDCDGENRVLAHSACNRKLGIDLPNTL